MSYGRAKLLPPNSGVSPAFLLIQSEQTTARLIGISKSLCKNSSGSQRHSEKLSLSHRPTWASKVAGRVEVSIFPNLPSHGD